MSTSKKIVLVGEVIVGTCESFRQLHSITSTSSSGNENARRLPSSTPKKKYVNNKKFIVRPQVSSSINKGIEQQPAE